MKFFEEYRLSKFSDRTRGVLKNILLSGFVKIGSVAVSLLVVPVTLNYMSQDHYGIWLTIYSIMTWLQYFDGGLGSGLRNRFTEAKAKNQLHKIKSYISTSYFILFCTIATLITIFSVFNIWFNWADFFNLKGENAVGFNNTLLIIFVIFCLQFVLRLIDNVLIADQRSGEADLLNLMSSSMAFIAFYILSPFFSDSLRFVGIVFSGVPFLVSLVYTIFLFRGRYKMYLPSFKFIQLKNYRDLMNLGSKFFVIQLVGLITLGSTNLIITKVLGAADVVVYNLAFKYFSVALLGFTILTSSIYSPLNEAYQLGDYNWIKNIIRKARLLSILAILGVVVMMFSARHIYLLWLGPTVDIPFALNAWMALYFGMVIWVLPYTTFITGVSKVKIAFYMSLLNSIFYIPTALLCAKYFGVEGIIIAQIIMVVSGLYWAPVQYKKIINNEAVGIWSK